LKLSSSIQRNSTDFGLTYVISRDSMLKIVE